MNKHKIKKFLNKNYFNYYKKKCNKIKKIQKQVYNFKIDELKNENIVCNLLKSKLIKEI